MRGMPLASAITCVCLFCTPAVRAQADLATAHLSPTLYFSSNAEESTSRAALHARAAPEVSAIASSNAESVTQELDRCEALLSALRKHEAFLKVRTLEDTLDQAAKKARAEVDTDQSVLEAAMDDRLRRLSPIQTASLGRYVLLAQTAQREAAHALSVDAERYRGEVYAPMLNSLYDDYARIEGGLKRPKEATASDTTTRRRGLTAWDQAYDQAAPEEAALLGTIVDLENRDAIAQGYKNAADRKYQLRGLSDALVTTTLAAVQAEAPAYRHYQEVLAQHAAKVLGVAPVLSTEVDLAAAKAPAIPLPEAKRLILDALQPLGTDYTKRFAALLDPANGRLDLDGGAHRARTGTSIDGVPTALYYSGYDGTLRNVSTIAHEGGHAIHRELMNAGSAPLYQHSGPSYFFEGFAIFNELLLLEHATKIAQTPAEKAYALERLLWKLTVELFVSAEETEFERSLYTQSVGKQILDQAEVDSLFRTSIAPYEYWPASDVGQSRGWMRKSLVFEDPLYLVNYLYASVVAVALFEKSHTDPDFAGKYEVLLRRGFDVEPQALLATLGIRLDDPALIKPASRLLSEKTEELERAYAEEGAR